MMGQVFALDTLLLQIGIAFPGVSAESVHEITSHGQNNLVLVVDEMLVFRFPRYPSGIKRLKREVAILKAIRERLPLAVPDPCYVALGDEAPGQVFICYPRIHGQSLSWANVAKRDPAMVGTMGEQIGGFIRGLHAIGTSADLPEAFRQELAAFEPTAQWRDLYARFEARLFRDMRPGARLEVRRALETFFDEAAGYGICPTLIHGDFGPANILYDPKRKRITGVIDARHRALSLT